MKRKRFRIFMITFIIISISVLSGFMINNFQHRKKQELENTIQPTITEGLDGSSSGSQEERSFNFYVNETAVKKTKKTSNEVTNFVLEAKLFITNKSSNTETIDPDAFMVNYNTEGCGLLYSIDYGDIEKPIILEGKATTSINFVVTYLIQDVENFNDNKKQTLQISYINNPIITCLV
jgi:hypothetical protein